MALKFFAEARLRSAVVLTGWLLPLRGRVQEVSTGFRVAYGHVRVAVTIAHGPPKTPSVWPAWCPSFAILSVRDGK